MNEPLTFLCNSLNAYQINFSWKTASIYTSLIIISTFRFREVAGVALDVIRNQEVQLFPLTRTNTGE
jgi:hypothetical protein